MSALRSIVKFPLIWFLLVGGVAALFSGAQLWPYASSQLHGSLSSAIGEVKGIPPSGTFSGTIALPNQDGDSKIVFRKVHSSSNFETAPRELTIQENYTAPNRLSIVRTSFKSKNPLGNVPKLQVVQWAKQNSAGHGPVTTRTYFDANEHSLPVMSIVFEEGAFFSSDSGIYIPGAKVWDNENFTASAFTLDQPWWEAPGNYQGRGKTWERQVHIDYFSEIGALQFSIPAGVRINGNATRAFPQKSLRLYTREKYGCDTLRYPLFGAGELNRFCNIILRNGGNDWDRTLFRDGLAQAIMEPLTIELQHHQPIVVYLNGEYWGIHNIRDRLNETHFAIANGLNEDDLIMLEKNSEVYHGSDTAAKHFMQWLNFAETADPNQQEYFTSLNNAIDLTNFTDYMLAECWLANTDWPNNNVKYWKPLTDGRWKWMLYDTDYGMGYTSSTAYTTDMFVHLKKSNAHIARLFFAMLENADYRNMVEQRAAFMLNNCTNNERTKQLYTDFKQRITAEMPNQIVRWREPRTLKEWEGNSQIMNNFVAERNAWFEKQLQSMLTPYGP